MHPSSSGLLVICAYFPQTTFPPAVTSPSSETLTSMIVPLVMTPSCYEARRKRRDCVRKASAANGRTHGRLTVYMGDWGFFLTERIGSWKVALRSGWVTLAFLYRSAIGLTNLSIFTGFRVKPSPTNVAFETIRFHDFDFDFPDLSTLNISSSAIPRTLGRGTAYLAARSFRRSLTADESDLAS
jgi:hypothetical protein